MYEVFDMRKVVVKISAVSPDDEIMQFNDRECTLITTALLNRFTRMLLAKRFAQIDSLLRTDPRNIMKKLKYYHLTNDVEFVEHMKISNAKIYVWETNSGNKVFIIPPLHVMFITSNNNCYVIKYPIEDIL
ncbi:MAG: hypothetical protein QXR31_04455 [Zestosphaera sp.]